MEVKIKDKYTPSIRNYGFSLALLANIFALFIVFAWKDEEDRKDFLSGWISGILTILIVVAAISLIFIAYKVKSL